MQGQFAAAGFTLGFTIHCEEAAAQMTGQAVGTAAAAKFLYYRALMLGWNINSYNFVRFLFYAVNFMINNLRLGDLQFKTFASHSFYQHA